MAMFDAAYMLLAVFTASIATGICALWRLTRSPQFVLGLALVYYYSLAGAWKILDLKWSGAESAALDHLEASLFPITIDETYLLTISIYGVFNLSLVVSLCFMAVGAMRPREQLRPLLDGGLSLAHGR